MIRLIGIILIAAAVTACSIVTTPVKVAAKTVGTVADVID